MASNIEGNEVPPAFMPKPCCYEASQQD